MSKQDVRGITVKADLIKDIEGFIDRNPELGWATAPEAVRYAWNKFVAEYKR
ncbi:unnamed protein product [marine sediment metagenome]|uniref:Uncharacterized protein n=1 Tax=marine sediment metagenome TaxID=412755 RepID=X1Q2Q5_9ZZZZ